MKFVIHKPKARSGFSLPELLATVAVVGILAGIGYIAVSNFTDSVKEQKLKNEVAMLNSAISSYLGFGGNLDKANTADDALAKLRSVAASKFANRIPGLSSSMVDGRIKFVYQDAKDAATNTPRVYWNATKKRFDFARSGKKGGISKIYIDTNAAEPKAVEDDRSFTVLYAENDSWVWDYQEQSPVPTTGPTKVATVDFVDIPSTSPGGAPLIDTEEKPAGGGSVPPVIDGGTTDQIEEPESETDEEEEEEPTQLENPIFSIPAGAFPISDYALQLSISNPNNAGNIYYQVDYGAWNQLASGGVIDVEPDQVIGAQVIASNENWTDSSRIEQSYSATPEKLESPVINLSASSFGVLDQRVIAVVLKDTNPSDVPSTLQYKINDGPWFDYADDDYLLLDRVDFENGAAIHGRAISEDPNYLPSDSSFDAIAVDPMELAGSASGEFYNPDSTNAFDMGMVTNLNYGNSASDYFEWGRITSIWGSAYEDYSKSWMDFDTQSAADINLGGKFQIGSLDYFNGKYVADTGANSVDLGIDLALNIGGQDVSAGFNYEFDLINSVNDDLDLYGWVSADYVQIDRPSSSTTFEIDGLVFELVLEFGDASSNGFATVDEFHVREEFSASTNLYATIFDRTESQGTVGSDGQFIEAKTIDEAIAPEGGGIPAPVDTVSSKSNWWSTLSSWLDSFRG